MRFLTFLMSALFISPFAMADHHGHDHKHGHDNDIMVHHAYVRATPPTAVNSAMFAMVMNKSDQDRVIVSASVDSSVTDIVELHDVITEGDVMKMRQVQQIVVPANGKVELKPGSLHVMFMKLKKSLNEGDELMVTLTFKNGESIEVKAPVKKVASAMKHHNHDH